MSYMTTNTDPRYYVKHTTEALRSIVIRYNEMARQMVGHPLGIEAFGIATAAEAALMLRGEKA